MDISCTQTLTFREIGKTHQNITILTMCKIYNVNNNKTADICCYHYIMSQKKNVVIKFTHSRPTPGTHICKNFNIHQRKKRLNENDVEFDFIMGTVILPAIPHPPDLPDSIFFYI